MIDTLFKRILKTLSIAGLLALLVGCDGGIFGTGDGSSGSLITDSAATSDSAIVDSGSTDGAIDAGDAGDAGDSVDSTNSVDAAIPNEPQSPAVDSNAGGDVDGAAEEAVDADNGAAQSPGVSDIDSAGDIDISVGTTDEFVAANDSIASVNGQLTFNNNIVVDDITTRFTFVNQTTFNLGVFDGLSDEAQSLLTLNADASGSGFFNSSISALYIDQLTDDGNRINQITIDPLTIASGSDSLFILVESNLGIRLLAMPTYNDVASEGTFPRRIIATELVGDPAVPSVFVLTPDPSIDGSDQLPVITFNPISAELPVTDFQNIPVGEYLLSDESGRFSELITGIRVEADIPIRTLILNPDFPDRVLGFGR